MLNKSVRIVCALLLVGALSTVSLSSRSSRWDSSPDSGAVDFPGATFGFLADGNKLDWTVARRVGRLSPYDALVKKHAEMAGMDWRLLSAIIFHESHYNAEACSPMNAKGLMQLRDVVASHFGYEPDSVDLYTPDFNIYLGTRLISDLCEDFRKEGVDSADVLRFALASYNVGGGSLARRREEATSQGLDPNSGPDVASVFSSTGNTTAAYIDAVELTYRRYCQIIK